MAQSFLNTLNQKLPLPKRKPLLRATGIPIVGANGINALCTLATRSPNWVSVYHRYSKFFFPQLTREAQVARLRLNRSVTVTSILNSTQDPSYFSIQDDEFFLRGLKVDDDENLIYLQNVGSNNNEQNDDEGTGMARDPLGRRNNFTTRIETNSASGVTTIRSNAGETSEEGKARRRELLKTMRDDPATTKTTYIRDSLMNTSSSSAKNNIDENNSEDSHSIQFRRDLSTYDILFPFADFIDGCARGRTGIGISPIHGRGLFATSKIPKGSVVICIKVIDFVDPIAMMIISKSPRSLPTLWRYYSPTGGAAFPVPISANATHFMNHSCDPTLRAGFFYPLDGDRISNYRNRLNSLTDDDRIDPEKLNERKNSFERNVDGIFGSDLLFSSSSSSSSSNQNNKNNKMNLFVKDPTEWFNYALQKGGGSGTGYDFDAADEVFEPPLLKSMSDEEVREFKRQGKPFGVDWNCFVAARDIESGEELTYDYARHLAPSHAKEFVRTSSASPCNCGSKYCTGDLYRSVPTKLDLVSTHSERVRLCKPYFMSSKSLLNNNTTIEEDDDDQGEPKIQSMSHLMDDKYDESYFKDLKKDDSKNPSSSSSSSSVSTQQKQKASTTSSSSSLLSKDDEEVELLLSGSRDPHDDDLVRASFIRNRAELMDKMHRTLPRTIMFRGPVVSNSNLTCEYLTSVMAKEKIVMPMGSTVGELH